MLGRQREMPGLEDVYRKFGEVSEAAQLFETQLGNILLTIEGIELGLFLADRQEEAREILRRINKSTLGQLLKKIDQRNRSVEHTADLFAGALAERNRLSHSFFRKHNFRRNSSEGCGIMLEDLESIHETLLKAYKVALAISGIDLDSLHLPGLPTKHLGLD